MKKLMIVLFAVCVWEPVPAQEFRFKPTGNLSDTKVVIGNFFGEIRVEGTNGSEVVITAEGYEGLPEKAKGLKPLSATGTENTGIGLSVVQEGTEIRVSAASRNASDATYTIMIPKNMKLMVDFTGWQAGDMVVTGMSNEIEARSRVGDIILKEVIGPVIAHTLSADIQVSFSALDQDLPTSISSTSGDVDITLPPGTKGSFVMSSTSGEIYTDFDFEFDDEKKGMRRFGGMISANARLNGGGVEVGLRTVSGDIYVRKAK